jgi:hypothetical protein
MALLRNEGETCSGNLTMVCECEDQKFKLSLKKCLLVKRGK